MSNSSLFAPVFCLCLTFSSGHTQEVSELWPEETNTTRPWSRWWWMGNAVDQENIKTLMADYAGAGLGGLEIAPIYGAKGYEDRYIDYLSPRWRGILSYTIEQADSHGMEIDLTQGTGWPFGGPWVTRQDAASKMIIEKYSLHQGDQLNGPIRPDDSRNLDAKLEAVVAFNNSGEKKVLTTHVNKDGTLHWTPDHGNWEILALFNGKTGQKVKRAAPGGAGWTLNHYAEDAVNHYLEVFDSSFQEKIPGIRAFFNDSYEVYGANWTAGFLTEFKKRRGYDLTPFLPDLISEENTDTSRRVKSDYRETLNELLRENFTKNWTSWAHQHGKSTRNQAHGSPGNLLDLYGAVDIPECETFGSSYFPIPGLIRDSNDIRNVDPDPVMLKFASSAAHVTGKKLTSSETFTWLGEHFKSSFAQMKPELEQTFLAGVNHMFYHGITYSPLDARWPGWLFYASLSLSPANSLWPHFSDFNNYVARCQSVLQAGQPDNELLIYWPIYDIWADPGKAYKTITVHNIDDWLHPTAFYNQAIQLGEAGYSLDFISDQQILNSTSYQHGIITAEEAPVRKALIVPSCHYMPVKTLRKLMQLAHNGSTVIFQEKPEDVPGLNNLENRRKKMAGIWNQLEFKSYDYDGMDPSHGSQMAMYGQGKILITTNVPRALASLNIYREKLTDTGLKFIRRKSGELTYYFLVNHTNHVINTTVTLNEASRYATLMDPLSSKCGSLSSKLVREGTAIPLFMKPGDSYIIRLSDQPSREIQSWNFPDGTTDVITLEGPWKLDFIDGGPVIPRSKTLNQLRSWTDFQDTSAVDFSGQSVYETNFTIDEPGDYILNLGQVHESARVWLNGQEVGYAWSLPYELDVTGYIRPGENNLKIEVANLMANRIRYMDRKGISWRNYHEINFVNIDYQPFDASGWEPMPSGLLGPVKLIRK